MRESITTIFCDYCKKEIDEEYDCLLISCESGSYLYLTIDEQSFKLKESDFCNLDCFFKYVKDKINVTGVMDD